MYNLNNNSCCTPSATNSSLDIDGLDQKSFTRESKMRTLHDVLKTLLFTYQRFQCRIPENTQSYLSFRLLPCS